MRDSYGEGPPVERGKILADSGDSGDDSVVRSAGLLPSCGTIGDGFDTAMMESEGAQYRLSCSTTEAEDPDWLALAIFDYIEIVRTANAATPRWTIIRRLSTNFPSTTTPPAQSISHRDWNLSGHAVI
ncbi:hypothetical protein [Nocardia salmonicida]|uniref:hypothetical protein n=1 Tax=Nocardia salmonicida TaxID=53431 RepID=UPI0036393BF7